MVGDVLCWSSSLGGESSGGTGTGYVFVGGVSVSGTIGGKVVNFSGGGEVWSVGLGVTGDSGGGGWR